MSEALPTRGGGGEDLLHATLVVWRKSGLLLRGPSGSGKSDLALRLVHEGARLVADDRVAVGLRDGRLVGCPPRSIAGLMEVRGVGIVEVPHLASSSIDMVVEMTKAEEIERLPEAESQCILGRELPVVRLDPREASAMAKLAVAVAAHGRLPVIEESGTKQSARRSGASAAPRVPEAQVGDGMSDLNPESTDPVKAAANQGRPPPVVLVTGMSGAGRSTSLKVLEDLGYEAIDNLPLDLMSAILSEGAVTRPLAVGIDTRSRNFAVQPLLSQVDRLIADTRAKVTLLFLDCEDDVLQRRFTETRRTHPLAQGRPLADGLRAERQLVEPLRSRADLVIDTSALAPHDLRRLLTGHLSVEGASHLAVFVTSFSYKHGIPREADLVFDVRFLKNPHYDDALRPLSGRDSRVAAFVEQDPDFPQFFSRLTDMLAPLLPRYEAEGKSYLTIAVGCTGGRHRSVAIAEKLADWLAGQGRQVALAHRDLAEAAAGDRKDAEDADADQVR